MITAGGIETDQPDGSSQEQARTLKVPRYNDKLHWKMYTKYRRYNDSST